MKDFSRDVEKGFFEENWKEWRLIRGLETKINIINLGCRKTNFKKNKMQVLNPISLKIIGIYKSQVINTLLRAES